jgi:PAS domain S-box-containing protein
VATTAARAYLVLGVIAVALNAAIGGSDLLYNCFGFASAAAIFAGTALNRPRAWRAWVGIGIAQTLMGLGDVVYSTSASSPALSDAFYLGAVGCLVVSTACLMFAVAGRVGLSPHIDAALIALIVGVCAWATFAPDVLEHGSKLVSAISVSYPISDLVLLALVVRVVFVRGDRTASYWLLLAAVGVLFLSDGAYVLPMIASAYHPGGVLDAGWLSAYVLFGAAALHPSMTRIVEAQPQPGPSLPVRRAFVLGIGLIAVPTAMLVQRIAGGHMDGVGSDIAMAAIAGGVVLRGAFLVRDLERLRRKAEQSERRFRMVFESAPVGISIGSNGIMSETNPALQRMLGYSGSEFARMHYTEVTHPDDQDIKQQLELDAGSRDAFAVDKRYRHKDGSWVEAHVHVALDLEDGLGISLVENVTGRRELEDQLRQAQKMDSIGKLAGGIAHDFNNLMTAVMGYSDLLMLRIGADDDARRKVEAIRESAVRASDLTRQLLAFSRRQILQTQEIDLRDVVERMDSLLTRLIGDDVQLRTLFGSEPVMVRADPTQLEQVVMNLAVNARDAMPDGGTLTIAVLSDGESAVLSVVDQGTGMDAETQARAFEPFFTTKPLAESSGLGLSTVHGIVGQSGGTVDIDSEPGRGTAFTIRLPAAARPGVLPGEPVLSPDGPLLLPAELMPATLID